MSSLRVGLGDRATGGPVTDGPYKSLDDMMASGLKNIKGIYKDTFFFRNETGLMFFRTH